ncbi:UDP-N-acetylglucosamine 1-carboxyvinyltransferase [Patescibacteria group bacterium]
MDVVIKGGQTLSGEVFPSGYKNAAVALIPASIIFDKPVTLKNVPDIADVDRLVSVLKKLGSTVKWDKKMNVIVIDNSNLRFEKLTRKDLGNMKGISLLWGPMLARFGKVSFEGLPGGCTLGFRTLKPHYRAFSDLGVKIVEDKNTAEMDATNAKASEIYLSEMSPTATENAIMLAVGLKGQTRIFGAASEPQVQDLCSFLTKSGVKINGIASSVLEIEGGSKLAPVEHTIISDDHEVATFISLAASTGGSLKVHGVNKKTFEPIRRAFMDFGVKLRYEGDTLILDPKQDLKISSDGTRGYLHFKPRQWPGVMVDNLPLFIPLALAAKSGQVLFHNWMYDGGLFWVSELQKMGANIIIADPHRVLVTAGAKLSGDVLEAPYIIRAVIAMMMVAMIAEGETTILNADVLYRGHPNFSQNLKNLGASIREKNK